MIARALGIDFGDVRIGLALSDELGMLAHPLETIQVRGMDDALNRIVAIIDREKVAMIILGMPRNMNGTYGPAAEKVRAFKEKLILKTGCEIRFWDERLSSVEAQKSLHASGKNVKQSRAVIDQVAAQLILQSYLDSQSMLQG